jgi:hypothetical protein
MTKKSGVQDIANSSIATAKLKANEIVGDMDTEEEFEECFRRAIENLDKEKMKTYKQEKIIKGLEAINKDLNDENGRLHQERQVWEAKRTSKSERKRNIAAWLAKIGEALPADFKKSCDAEAEEYLAQYRAKSLNMRH